MGERYLKNAPTLVDLGYDVTPVEGKRPVIKRWSTRPDTAKHYTSFPDHNIGIVLGGLCNLIAIDVDVCNELAAKAIQKLIEDEFGTAPRRIGKAPKFLMPFRCTEPIKKIAGKIFKIDGQKAQVEILAEGQQFVAFGIHPDTGKEYDWPDDSILDYPITELPVVTPEALKALLVASEAILTPYCEQPQPTRQLVVSDNAVRLQCMKNDDNWHDNMRDLVASRVAERWTDQQILSEAMTGQLPGYTAQQTIEEVQTAIDGARAKGFDKQNLPAIKPSPFITLKEALNMPPPSFLIDGVLLERGVGFLAGASQSLKSFVAAYFAVCIAGGFPLGDRKVVQGNVLYAALEGFPGISWRYLAAQQYHNVEEPILFQTDIDFTRPESVEYLKSMASEVDNLKLIIIDTLDKATPGADENSKKDMSKVIEHAYELAKVIDGMVLLIHHLGKDASKGLRGSSSLHAGADNVLLLKRTKNDMALHVKKVKDAEDDFYVNFTAHKFTATNPDDGEMRETLVADIADPGGMSAPDKLRLILSANPGLTRAEILEKAEKMSLNVSLRQKDIDASLMSLKQAITRGVKSGEVLKDAENRHYLSDDDGE